MIPVFEPDVGEDEALAVAHAIRRGEISGTYGPSLDRFERELAARCGAKHGIAVTSGTAALHVAAAALDLHPGDEVLVSASTNIATALGVYHAGATPVPVDVDATTWNLDLDQVERAITPRTRAIFPVHLFGHPVDMDRLNAIARAHQLRVVEDAAEALGARVRDKPVGALGDIGCLSFYANKHITTGEGGMLLTNDDALAERLRLLRNLGFTTPRFRHEIAGFNFRMTAYAAAMGIVQLGKLDAVIAAKRRLAGVYDQHLSGIPGLQLPVELPWAFHVYWMYGVVVDPTAFGVDRDTLAARLRARGVDTRTFFCPMNEQPCFAHLERCRAQACPVAERLWRQGLYLPSSLHLSEADVAGIADAIRTSRAS